MSNEQALKMIDEFEVRDAKPAFQQAIRKTVAAEMRERVNNPFLVQQGPAGVCGPTTVVFNLLRRDPVFYVTAVVQLFEWGGATINHWQLKPGRYLLTGAFPQNMAQADWILLASIRDSENWFYQYTAEVLNGTASGSSLSELEDWYKKAGYKDVTTNDISSRWDVLVANKEKNLKASLEKYKNDYQVTWSIDASAISSGVPDSPSGNHVVVLAGDFTPPANQSDAIHIPIFTWGRKTTLPESGGLTYGQFLSEYFGYVAAK